MRSHRQRRWTMSMLMILSLFLFAFGLPPVMEWTDHHVSLVVDNDKSTPWKGRIPPPQHPPEIASTRAQRFPSVEERIRLYMGNWYVPPCHEYDKGKIVYRYLPPLKNEPWEQLWIREASDRNNASQFVLQSAVEPDKTFFAHRETIEDCMLEESSLSQLSNRTTFRFNMHLYCHDVVDSLLQAYDHVALDILITPQTTTTTTTGTTMPPPPPLLMQFGDLAHSHEYRFLNVPLFKKFRAATTSQGLETTTAPTCLSTPRVPLPNALGWDHLQPIIWKLATERHYGHLPDIYRRDIPYELKRDQAVFRGQLTGSRIYNKKLTAYQNCWNLKRCRLVLKAANSTLLDAKLTSTRGRLPTTIDGISIVSEKITSRSMLKYKAIVMLEGNDVASGLKWALLSQSVVLMPTPTQTSWAMEELLEPWVHYVPIAPDLSDVEIQTRWILEHEEYARRISERATLWMQDMVFHPDALEEDVMIQEEMMRRYVSQFGPEQATIVVQ